MVRSIAILMVMTLTVSACGRIAESRFNPLNWFGQQERIEDVAVEEQSDPRPVVDQVIGLSIDRTPGGAIVRAVGLPTRQGHFAAALVREAGQPGVIVYTFRLVPPPTQTRVSTQRSREVVAGAFLSDQDLTGIREVQVLGARASRSIRR